MDVLKITRRTIAEAALPLLVAGKLQRQLQDGPGCYYRHPEDNSPCVVGAAIPDDYFATCVDAYNCASVRQLVARGIIEIADNEVGAIGRLQLLHDDGKIAQLEAALVAILAEPVS